MNIDHYGYSPVYGGIYYPTEYLHTPEMFMNENQIKNELKNEIEAEQKLSSAKEKRDKWIRQLKHMERALEVMYVETRKLRMEIAKSWNANVVTGLCYQASIRFTNDLQSDWMNLFAVCF